MSFRGVIHIREEILLHVFASIGFAFSLPHGSKDQNP